jgi:hypothetical protein
VEDECADIGNAGPCEIQHVMGLFAAPVLSSYLTSAPVSSSAACCYCLKTVMATFLRSYVSWEMSCAGGRVGCSELT